jgi:cyclase
MALAKRIISRLDIKNNTLVKGIHLEGLRVLGDPKEFAFRYFEEGIDEIHYQDVVASLYDRNQLDDVIENTVKNIFVPICVGGGIRTLEDIDKLLKLGADKVVINSAAVKDPDFIKEATIKYGSSTIAVAIEAIRINNGKDYKILTESGRQNTDLDILKWLEKIQKFGAGEIIVTSIDNEGTKKGYDIELCSIVKKNSNVPVIAHGGAGKIDDIIEVFKKTDVDAVSIATILHYNYLNLDNQSNQNSGNYSFINKITKSKDSIAQTINQIKSELEANDIKIRK